MDDTKSIFKSKTAWAGLAVAVVGALQAFHWEQLIPKDPTTVGYITAGLGGVMIVLRYLTSTPVTVTGSN